MLLAVDRVSLAVKEGPGWDTQSFAICVKNKSFALHFVLHHSPLHCKQNPDENPALAGLQRTLGTELESNP